jgi:elongation factor Tu
MLITNAIVRAGCLAGLMFSLHFTWAQCPSARPVKTAVLGSAGDSESANLIVAALRAEEKERGITINTSHVEYETTKRSARGSLVETVAGGAQFDAGLLIGTGGDLRDVVECAQLARVLGLPRLLVSLDSTTGTPAGVALLQKWLAYLGYSPDQTSIAIVDLAGIRCQNPPGVGALLDALLKLCPQEPDLAAPFLMPVEDVAKIPQGAEAFGEITAGVVQVGDPVEIVGLRDEPLKSTITGIEMFRKLLDRGQAGDNVGLLLRGIEKKDIKRGMVIVKPGSVSAHREIKAEVYVLKKEEGGRHTPFHNRMTSQLVIRTAEVEGTVTLAAKGDGTGGTVEPSPTGLQTDVTVKLIVPIAMDKGLRFAIREGGRTVGAGQVTEIIK